jgi:hypothetical protein
MTIKLKTYERDMLDLWAEKQREIANAVELFLDLEARKIIEWNSMSSPPRVIAEFFGIDHARLEKQRANLLQKQRELNESLHATPGR